MDTSWKTDPRLKNMNQEKLDLLIRFASELEKKPKDQLMTSFLTLNQQAAAKGLDFTDSESELIASIITEKMPPEEKKKMQTLRLLAKKLSGKSK